MEETGRIGVARILAEGLPVEEELVLVLPGAEHDRRRVGPGSHEYKFLIDGKSFRQDPGNPDSAGFFHNSLIGLP